MRAAILSLAAVLALPAGAESRLYCSPSEARRVLEAAYPEPGPAVVESVIVKVGGYEFTERCERPYDPFAAVVTPAIWCSGPCPDPIPDPRYLRARAECIEGRERRQREANERSMRKAEADREIEKLAAKCLGRVWRPASEVFLLDSTGTTTGALLWSGNKPEGK